MSSESYIGLVPEDQLWIVITGFLISFILAIALGANDVANSFATSVGSKVLTLRGACILGSIFEVAGAMLLGARVSDTIRKGIIDVNMYVDSPDILLVGNLAALAGACVWLLIATVLKLPVSGTHSIVGATLGFSLVARGDKGVDWLQAGLIVVSWVASPVLSGIVSVLLFLVVKYFIINKVDSLTAGLRFLPLFYGLTIFANFFSIFYNGPEQLEFDKIPLWGVFILSIGPAVIVALVIQFVVAPWQKKRILADLAKTEEANGVDLPALASGSTAEEVNSGFTGYGSHKKVVDDLNTAEQSDMNSNKPDTDNPNHNTLSATKTEKIAESGSVTATADAGDDDGEQDAADSNEVKDKPELASLFKQLQILTAVFASFVHGGNDVSNAIGPLVAVWLISTEGNVLQEAPTPLWVLFYGGVGITVGLWALGRRVIQTMGEDLTKVTPTSGFCIEMGATITVLVGSNLKIPLSTTHCKVGSVVAVGRVRSRENVDWKLFVNIIIAWLVTVPASMGVSAGIFYGLQYLVPPLGPPWLSNADVNSTLLANNDTTFF